MAIISKKDKDALFLKIKHLLGYPYRRFEVDNSMMDSYFDIALENYSSEINQWLIEQNWINLYGKNASNIDFIAAFTNISNDYTNNFTYAYSKQVGLGANAPAASGWELKKDYIIVSGGCQHYTIPAGREINEILWETPPEIWNGYVDPFALGGSAFGVLPGSGVMGLGGGGRQSMYMQPVYSTLLNMQDLRMKQKLTQSTLSYRITGTENGTKILHLYPIPGSKQEISGEFGKHYDGTKVWYFYYDTTPRNRKKCILENSDIIRVSSDVPTEVLQWNRLNDVAKQQIRDLFLAEVKIAVGGIRGFFTGEIGVAEKQLTMDYRHLLEEGQALKDTTLQKISESLQKLSQSNVTEERAKIAQNVNIALSYQPMRTPILRK